MSEKFENRFLEEILHHNELVQDTVEILNYLRKKHYRLHVLSNGFQEVTSRKCELSGITEYFETITSADEINIRKPQPEVFAYALQKSGAAVEESIIIGDDWIADIEGGLAFGMDAVFFDRFNDDYDAEVKTVKTLAELKNFL